MKPKICEILGVELNEEFQFNNVNYAIRQMAYAVRSDEWRLENKLPDGSWSMGTDASILVDMMEHPEGIVHIPRWTEKDIADAKAFVQLIPYAEIVKRTTNGISIEMSNSYKSHAVWENIFPSIKNGQIVKLSEILEAAQDET